MHDDDAVHASLLHHGASVVRQKGTGAGAYPLVLGQHGEVRVRYLPGDLGAGRSFGVALRWHCREQLLSCLELHAGLDIKEIFQIIYEIMDPYTLR